MTVTIPLTKSGMSQLNDVISDMIASLESKGKNLVSELVELGKDEAINNLGHIDTGETLESIQGEVDGLNGKVVAGGAAVWLEFGTGIHYNASDPYPQRPDGIVGIGQYGKGHGSQDGWYYPLNDEKTEYRFTHGIPAQMFMYNSAKTMEEELPNIAKKVFE